MFRALKLVQEEKTLVDSKDKELKHLYNELRESIALKEKMDKKLKDNIIFRNFMNKVLLRFYLVLT